MSRFPPAAYRYFDSLRLLYARYKYDNLSKEDAAAEKQKLLAQYNEATAAVNAIYGLGDCSKNKISGIICRDCWNQEMKEDD